jgi:hypothetical protein
MAQSVTGIANRALQLVGAASILNLTDTSVEAREVSRCYDMCRRAELRAHQWNFAIVRAALAPDAAAPAFGYTYQFSVPTDCLRILLPNDSTLDWMREGQKILTNWTSSPVLTNANGATGPILYLRYVQDVTDATVFDPMFCEALAHRIAFGIVERLTQSNQKKAELKQDYKDVISEARRVDSFETLPEDPPDDDWWTVRIS